MNQSNWKLFIDDLRFPAEDDFVITRTIAESIQAMEHRGCPQYISFDHDLGGDETAFQIVKWMVEKDLDLAGGFIPQDFSFFVHSANPVGKKNIESYLNNYLGVRSRNG